DAPGMVDAVGAGLRPGDVVVLGAGGTARAALGAAARLGAERVTVVARRADAVAALEPVAAALGLRIAHRPWDEAAEALGAGELVVSRVPKAVAGARAGRGAWRPGAVLRAVLYAPWPTPLAASASGAGPRVVSGLDLLLAQAVLQFEL